MEKSVFGIHRSFYCDDSFSLKRPQKVTLLPDNASELNQKWTLISTEKIRLWWGDEQLMPMNIGSTIGDYRLE